MELTNYLTCKRKCGTNISANFITLTSKLVINY